MVIWKACLVLIWLNLTIILTFLIADVSGLSSLEFNLSTFSRNTHLQRLSDKIRPKTIQDRNIFTDKALEEDFSTYNIATTKQFIMPEKILPLKYYNIPSTHNLKTKSNLLYNKLDVSNSYTNRTDYLNGQYFEQKVTPPKAYKNQNLEIQSLTKYALFIPYNNEKQFLILV